MVLLLMQPCEILPGSKTLNGAGIVAAQHKRRQAELAPCGAEQGAVPKHEVLRSHSRGHKVERVTPKPALLASLLSSHGMLSLG